MHLSCESIFIMTQHQWCVCFVFVNFLLTDDGNNDFGSRKCLALDLNCTKCRSQIATCVVVARGDCCFGNTICDSVHSFCKWPSTTAHKWKDWQMNCRHKDLLWNDCLQGAAMTSSVPWPGGQQPTHSGWRTSMVRLKMSVRSQQADLCLLEWWSMPPLQWQGRQPLDHTCSKLVSSSRWKILHVHRQPDTGPSGRCTVLLCKSSRMNHRKNHRNVTFRWSDPKSDDFESSQSCDDLSDDFEIRRMLIPMIESSSSDLATVIPTIHECRKSTTSDN